MTDVLQTRDVATAKWRNPGHGDAFTDHMYSLGWDEESGWQGPGLVPLEPVSMHPGMLGLHYAQVIFEGMKAFRQADGSIAVFRPDRNAQRFQSSARRLQMPELPEAAFLEAVDAVVRADQGSLSDDPQHSLYLRPLMYGNEANLMLRPSRRYEFLLMAFVAGGFFGDPPRPVSVLIGREHTRAVPGGTGDVKCAANYGPSFVAQQAAHQAGCDQVVWLDAEQRQWVEELGGMNLFFVRSRRNQAEVMTPALTGTLLPGVTRDSLLTLADRCGYHVSEGRISVDQWRQECAAGSITEVFACGTAAVVTPVGLVVDGEARWTVGDGRAGPVTQRLLAELTDVQHGRAADPAGWLRRVN